MIIDPEDVLSSRCKFNAAALIVRIGQIDTWRPSEIHSMTVKYKKIDGLDNDFKNANNKQVRDLSPSHAHLSHCSILCDPSDSLARCRNFPNNRTRTRVNSADDEVKTRIIGEPREKI